MPVDPFSPLVRRNPYPIYARLRDENPVHRSASGAWLVTRYSDVRAVLSDGRLGHWSGGQMSDPFAAILSRWVSLMDPRCDSRLRAHVNRLFAPGALEGHRSRIERLTDRLLDQVNDGGEIEVMRHLAEPLTIDVIGTILGVPESDAERFRALVLGLHGRLIDLVSGRGVLGAEFHSFTTYLEDLGRHGDATNPSSLTEAVLAARAAGDEIEPTDPVSFALIFLFAGHDNMMNFLGNATLALAQHPDAWDELAAEQGSKRTAVEELLRYDGPVQFVKLVVREPILLNGKELRAGDGVLASIGSANRDPAAFDHADSLDLSRRPNPHLGFGTGALHCVGAALARLQGSIVLDRFVRLWEPPRVLNNPIEWRAFPGVLRGPQTLRLGVRPRQSA